MRALQKLAVSGRTAWVFRASGERAHCIFLRMSSSEYMRDYVRRARAERRAKLLALLGGRCTVCGSTDDLEFDHINPATKSFTISGNEQYGWDKIVGEVAKCQLLCDGCHEKKTAVDLGFRIRAHGSPSMYRHHGCRCATCVAGWRAYQKRSHARQRAKKLASVAQWESG